MDGDAHVMPAVPGVVDISPCRFSSLVTETKDRFAGNLRSSPEVSRTITYVCTFLFNI